MQKQIKNICVLGCILVVGLLSMSRANAAAAKKDWTMLVYVNGNNNLDDFGATNIEQMQKVGSSDNLNIVVQWASMAASDTKRLLVKQDATATTVTSPVVQTLPVVDMGKKQTLVDFLNWGAQNYPANHYFVVVWDHGAGWHTMFKGGQMHMNDISFDERSGNHITTEELGQVITGFATTIGHKVDIYGSDACLMAMAEVVGEMSSSVQTFVGSQEVEPGDGWPYDRFLASWAAQPNADTKQIGKFLVDAYHSYYTDQGTDNTTFSAIDVSQYSSLVATITALKAKLMNVSDMTKVKTAAANSQRFYYADYVDLGDVISQLKDALAKTGEAGPELAQATVQLNNTVIASAITGSGRAQGISIWWPTESSDWSQYSARYKGLQFDKATKWDQLLSKMF